MTYNEKGNLRSLLGASVTSGMNQSTLREMILTATRRVDTNNIDATGNQRWHRVRVHRVDLECYGREPGGIKLIQREIETGTDNL